MPSFEHRICTLFETLHPLDRIARAGYVLRGVTDPESIAAHSHFVSLLTLFFVEEFPDQFDANKAIAMALVHDLSESELMDIPMPAADAYLGAVKDEAEQAILERMLEGFPAKFAAYHREFKEAATHDARLVRGLDKAHIMLKIIMYEREGRGRLKEFWANPGNFRDYGCEPVSRLFDALCEIAGHPRPREETPVTRPRANDRSA